MLCSWGISEDQWVARRAVLDAQPDVVIMILDATNLARNLYMLLQFMDLNMPVVVALNLIDEAEKRNIIIDVKKLRELLGIPVVPTIATTGHGLDELMHTAINVARNKKSHSLRYGEDIENCIHRLADLIPEDKLSPRALAILLLEEDSEFIELVKRLKENSFFSN